MCKELSQLDENYQIYGISRKRNLSSFYKKLESLNIKNNLPISITNVNLLSYTDVLNFIEQIKPQYCYNLSGPSSVYESIKNPEMVSNGIESIFENLINGFQKLSLSPIFFQASSSEMFGNNGKSVQNEQGPFNPNSPYAKSKLKIHNKIINLRKETDWSITSGIMFNHESEFRDNGYLISKIIHYCKNFTKNSDKLKIGSLNYTRDWSFAGDIVASLNQLTLHKANSDFVIGSGVGHKISDILSICFDEIKIDWEDVVEIDTDLLRDRDPEIIIADNTKLKNSIGWNPTLDFESLIKRCFNMLN